VQREAKMSAQKIRCNNFTNRTENKIEGATLLCNDSLNKTDIDFRRESLWTI